MFRNQKPVDRVEKIVHKSHPDESVTQVIQPSSSSEQWPRIQLTFSSRITEGSRVNFPYPEPRIHKSNEVYARSNDTRGEKIIQISVINVSITNDQPRDHYEASETRVFEPWHIPIKLHDDISPTHHEILINSPRIDGVTDIYGSRSQMYGELLERGLEVWGIANRINGLGRWTADIEWDARKDPSALVVGSSEPGKHVP